MLTTFTTHTDDLLELTLAESDEPIYLTDEHLVYSDDRDDWVPADELDVGECVLTEKGTACVAACQWRTGGFAIHNLEVDTTHSYYVEGDLLTHKRSVPSKGWLEKIQAVQMGQLFRRIKERAAQWNARSSRTPHHF